MICHAVDSGRRLRLHYSDLFGKSENPNKWGSRTAYAPRKVKESIGALICSCICICIFWALKSNHSPGEMTFFVISTQARGDKRWTVSCDLVATDCILYTLALFEFIKKLARREPHDNGLVCLPFCTWRFTCDRIKLLWKWYKIISSKVSERFEGLTIRLLVRVASSARNLSFSLLAIKEETGFFQCFYSHLATSMGAISKSCWTLEDDLGSQLDGMEMRRQFVCESFGSFCVVSLEVYIRCCQPEWMLFLRFTRQAAAIPWAVCPIAFIRTSRWRKSGVSYLQATVKDRIKTFLFTS